MTTHRAAPNIITMLRLFTLALSTFICMMTPVELLLLNHLDKPWQWIPFAALGALAAANVWVWRCPSDGIIRWYRASMGLLVLIGVMGVGFHLRQNYQLGLESTPEAMGWDRVLETLKGAAPALAPGLFVQLGALGLIFTYRHPALQTGALGDTLQARGALDVLEQFR
ncbi:hypothetical protein [Deinococcus rufus]|uniref:Uncharacterized protein n=1 Tax=Deinococcus rufus TaxID=2136097 RepID=A0ABV7Z9Q0_9DEIO